MYRYGSGLIEFQSTPSVWRETKDALKLKLQYGISIHSLRVEGDSKHCTSV